MSNATQGVVARISEKVWDGRDGQVTLYSFQVDGSNRWFRTGQNPPRHMGIEQGQAYSFEADSKGNVNPDTVRPIEKAEVAAAPAPQRSGGWKGGKKSDFADRDNYWKEKEQRDIAKDERYQAVDIPRMTFCTSQDAAVALVTAALQHDVLSLGGANKAAKLGLVLDYVDTVTQRFFKQRMAADASAVEPPAPKKSKAKWPKEAVDVSDGPEYDEEDE